MCQLSLSVTHQSAGSPNAREIFASKGPKASRSQMKNRSRSGPVRLVVARPYRAVLLRAITGRWVASSIALSLSLAAAWRPPTIWKSLSSNRKSILVCGEGTGAEGRESRLSFLFPSIPTQEHSRIPGRKRIIPQNGLTAICPQPGPPKKDL